MCVHTSQLHLPKGLRKGQPATCSTISQWLRQVIFQTYQLKEELQSPPKKLKFSS